MSELSRVPLTHLSGIHLEGPDTLKFLQGQCTQDVQTLAIGQVKPGAFCTAKGRTIANVYLVLLSTDTQSVLMISESSVTPILYAHLKKYAAFFRTMKMTDCSESHELIGLIGATALTDDVLSQVSSDEPAFLWTDNRAILWHAKAQDTQQPWQTLPEADLSQWQALDIQASRLWLDETQSGQWIPQNVSLDELDGISFKKGCYTGQEVVARLHFKGQSKKRLFKLISSAPLAPGDKVFADGKDIGPIIQVSSWQANTYALAVLKTDATESSLSLDENQQVAIELLH